MKKSVARCTREIKSRAAITIGALTSKGSFHQYIAPIFKEETSTPIIPSYGSKP
jgi:hypothetical protein